MPRHNRILPLAALLPALALTTACGYLPIGEATAPYEMYHGSTPEPWCAEGEDGYVLSMDSILQGPHFSTGIQCRYSGEQFPREVAEQLPSLADLPRAEDGSEFLANNLTSSPDADIFDAVGWPVRSWVQIGDQEFDLDAPPQRGDWIVVTAPTDADAVLWVEDDGRAQGLDLRTGERVEPVAAYYTGLADTSDILGGFKYEMYFADDPEDGLSCEYNGGDAWRTPWFEGLGWAPEGTVYLSVFTLWCDQIGEYSWNLDPASITLASGEAAEPVDWIETPTDVGLEIRALFVIPDFDSEVTIAFKPVTEAVGTDGRVMAFRDEFAVTEWIAEF
ncbi:hypothetical protein AB0K52_08390 [Glycomyces sp. NPDC049804]|uniref:hypothetical protein n=1 Tax=Glycomyces sp. NPDC049804 TaxID=3154363 RepID=UPI003442D643